MDRSGNERRKGGCGRPHGRDKSRPEKQSIGSRRAMYREHFTVENGDVAGDDRRARISGEKVKVGYAVRV